jgi:hypothetical protein
MRALLILLAIAAPIVLANPVFWWLVGTEISASPVTAIEADGTPTHSLLGPKAPWPDWAPKPDQGKFVVKAWFKPTPPRPETGFGHVFYRGDDRKAAADYAERLRREGWAVESWLVRSVYPSMPPRPSITCHIEAMKPDGDPRRIHASFGLEPGRGGIQWWSTPPELMQTARDESC